MKTKRSQKKKEGFLKEQTKIQERKKVNLTKKDFFPKKSLGQNFLKNPQVLEKIIKAAKIKEGDRVLEIGPGTGVLTQALIEKGAMVAAIEKDERLGVFLKEKFKKQKVIVVEGDVLEINLPLILEKAGFDKYKIVANIPYYITGQFLRLIFETKFLKTPQVIVLMVQKEVAERICASPSQMSLLSVSVQYFANPQIIDYVSREDFFPQPGVDSAILKIKPAGKKLITEETKLFFRLARIGFSQKRKKLINNLSGGLAISKKELGHILNSLGMEKNVRAQDLSVEEWKKLANKIKPLI